MVLQPSSTGDVETRAVVVVGSVEDFGLALEDDNAPQYAIFVCATTTATMLPSAYNTLVSALLPLMACLEHLLVSVYPGVIWHTEALCSSCLAKGECLLFN